MTAYGLLGFAKDPARKDAGKNHHAAALVLKTMCWITFVMLLIVAIAGVFLAAFTAAGHSLWAQPLQDSDAPRELVDFAVDEPGLAALIVLLAAAAFSMLLLLVLWWQSHTYALWNRGADNALVWANVLAAISLAFSLGEDRNVVALVLAVLLLAFANVAASRGELDAAGEQGTET